MWNKFKKWLFVTELKSLSIDNFDSNEIEKRLVSDMKKATAKKSAPKKKAPAKKAPAKKTAPKKTVKKTTKKK